MAAVHVQPLPIDAFNAVQQHIQEGAQWIKHNTVDNFPKKWAEQISTLKALMTEMERVWRNLPRQVEYVGAQTIFELVQAEEYFNQYGTGAETEEYKALRDNLERMRPTKEYDEEEPSDYAVAHRLVSRNEWYIRSVRLIAAGAVVAAVGLVTTELVLLTGVITAVAGAILGVATWVNNYGVALDKDYAQNILNAIAQRGDDDQFFEQDSQAPVGLATRTSRLLASLTPERAQRLRRAEQARAEKDIPWIHPFPDRKGKKGVSFVPVDLKKFKEIEPEVKSRALTSSTVRAILSELVTRGLPANEHRLWFEKQLDAVGGKYVRCKEQAGKPGYKQLFVAQPQQPAEAAAPAPVGGAPDAEE